MIRAFPNPRPIGPRPRFHESSELRSDRDSDSVGRLWRKSSNHAQQGQDVLQNVRQLQGQLDRLRVFKGAGSDVPVQGWRWASPKEYDPTKAYKKNQIIIVSPTNAAHVTGVSNGANPSTGGAIVGQDGFGPNTDRARAGTWVCVQAPKILSATQPVNPALPRNYDVHVPIWPLVSSVVDNLANFWMLISFYPIPLNVCVGGKFVLHYVNAQPAESILAGEGGEPVSGEGGESIEEE